MYGSPDPLDGLIIFGLLALWGVRLLIQGAKGETVEWCGTPRVARWTYLIVGSLSLLPIIAYCTFLARVGYLPK